MLSSDANKMRFACSAVFTSFFLSLFSSHALLAQESAISWRQECFPIPARLLRVHCWQEFIVSALYSALKFAVCKNRKNIVVCVFKTLLWDAE